MVRVENIPWANLGVIEKRILEICKKIIYWNWVEKKSHLYSCNALRLIDETNNLYEKFCRRPYFHDPGKMLNDLLEAQELYEKFKKIQETYDRPEANILFEETIELDLIKQTVDEVIAMVADLIAPNFNLTLIKKWRDNDDVVILIKGGWTNSLFAILLIERYLPFLTKSQPHFLNMAEALQREFCCDLTESPFESSDLGLDFFDYSHKNEIAQKTINICGLQDKKGVLAALRIILRQIADTPRIFLLAV